MEGWRRITTRVKNKIIVEVLQCQALLLDSLLQQGKNE
jgi:hypothetical protein